MDTRGCTLAALFALAPHSFGQGTTRASVSSDGVQANYGGTCASISADGRTVAFESIAPNLVFGDSNGTWDIFVRDLQLGTTERVSVSTGGVQGTYASRAPAISADGRFVAFASLAGNLDGPGGYQEIYVRDRLNGTTERVSLTASGGPANGGSSSASISADGRFVAFRSNASNLVAGDTNYCADIFVRDRLNATTVCASVDSSGAQADGASNDPSISADGRFVCFDCISSSLSHGDTNGLVDVFVHDLQTGVTERVSLYLTGGVANGESRFPSISRDDRFVAFCSLASNLVAGDTNGARDVFLRDRLSGTTERVSVDSGGAQANIESSTETTTGAVSADGRFVAFWSRAATLVAGDTNGVRDLFVRDRLTGTTERVSVDTTGQQGNGDTGQYGYSISADGRNVAFCSVASNFVLGDTNEAPDVFVRGGATPPPAPFCFGDYVFCPCGNQGAVGRGCSNSASPGGARLSASGSASLSSDTLVLSSASEPPQTLSIFLQGTTPIPAAHFGDGLLCIGGTLVRLYVRHASGDVASAPQPGDPAVSARSLALGDPLSAGALRLYQTYYRDPNLGFCPSPSGNSWNISSGLAVVWSQ